MIKLDREQTVSIGALALVVLICAGTLELSFHLRSGAMRELAERRELLSRLQAGVRAQNKGHVRSASIAPTAAFVNAETQGIAGAQLQAYLMQLAGDHHAVVISSGVDPSKREDPPEAIRFRATLDTNSNALQALLYQLESGTPYVFVDALSVQIPNTGSRRAAEDPLLRVTVGLRAVWRRGTG